MADSVILCALLITFCVATTAFSIQGFYCKDPDTGSLYPLNSTWPSSTFCGSYSCKLRKKNITSVESSPMKVIKVDNVSIKNASNEVINLVSGLMNGNSTNVTGVNTMANDVPLITSRTTIPKDSTPYETSLNYSATESSTKKQYNNETNLLNVETIPSKTTLYPVENTPIYIENKNVINNIHEDMTSEPMFTSSSMIVETKILPTFESQTLPDVIIEEKQVEPLEISHVGYDNNVIEIGSAEHFTDVIKPKTMINDVNKIKISPLSILNSSLLNDDNDRYLTDTEIKSISNLLHSVKKSDLESIVEVYNLAQDIYKEMDKITTESVIQDTLDDAGVPKFTTEGIQQVENQQISYWYDPLTHMNSKSKPPHGFKNEGWTVPPTIAQPRTIYPQSYFNPIHDAAKMSYYYPISAFQRNSGYINPTYSKPEVYPKPCPNHVHNDYQSYPWNYKSRPENIPAAQSYLLPYPFAFVNQYNMTSYPYNYFKQGWPDLDLNKVVKRPTYYENTFIEQIPIEKEIVAEEHEFIKEHEESSEEKVEVANELLHKQEENVKLPSWQTKPLASKIIEEVRANILEKSNLLKPLSFRKKIKLEKVGKVIKLDELTKRPKRDTDNKVKIEDWSLDPLHYELYIEKLTCDEKISDLGYYTIGNKKEYYPGCCPQKIQRENEMTDTQETTAP